jgi:dTMP kinase
MYIVVEGTDGSGTTTWTTRLTEEMSKSFKVIQTKEPTDGKVGRLIRKMMDDMSAPLDCATSALLFAADRKQHQELLSRALLGNQIVISDRGLLSSIVYQSIDGTKTDWLLELNKFTFRPDLLILLDPGLEVIKQRLAERTSRSFFEEDAFVPYIYHNYEYKLHTNNPGRFGKYVLRVDSGRDIENELPVVVDKISRLYAGQVPKDMKSKVHPLDLPCPSCGNFDHAFCDDGEILCNYCGYRTTVPQHLEYKSRLHEILLSWRRDYHKVADHIDGIVDSAIEYFQVELVHVAFRIVAEAVRAKRMSTERSLIPS